MGSTICTGRRHFWIGYENHRLLCKNKEQKVLTCHPCIWLTEDLRQPISKIFLGKGVCPNVLSTINDPSPGCWKSQEQTKNEADWGHGAMATEMQAGLQIHAQAFLAHPARETTKPPTRGRCLLASGNSIGIMTCFIFSTSMKTFKRWQVPQTMGRTNVWQRVLTIQS